MSGAVSPCTPSPSTNTPPAVRHPESTTRSASSRARPFRRDRSGRRQCCPGRRSDRRRREGARDDRRLCPPSGDSTAPRGWLRKELRCPSTARRPGWRDRAAQRGRRSRRAVDPTSASARPRRCRPPPRGSPGARRPGRPWCRRVRRRGRDREREERRDHEHTPTVVTVAHHTTPGSVRQPDAKTPGAGPGVWCQKGNPTPDAATVGYLGSCSCNSDDGSRAQCGSAPRRSVRSHRHR
jgi:hypothetical protein